MKTQRQQFKKENGVPRIGKQFHMNVTERVRIAPDEQQEKRLGRHVRGRTTIWWSSKM